MSAKPGTFNNKAAEMNHQEISIRTVDTDVVVIAVSLFHELNVDKLWIEFGSGRNKRWLPIHSYATKLGENVCRGLRFWYAFTGFDTVSSFCGRGKKISWDVWKSYPGITDSYLCQVNFYATVHKYLFER